MELLLLSALKIMRRILWILLITLFASIKLYSIVDAQVNSPQNVQVHVYDSVNKTINNVVIEWTQLSNADYVCISKESGVHIGCMNSTPGVRLFSTRAYVDGNYKHHYGDKYNITEYYGFQSSIIYGPYEALYGFVLPRIDKP